MTFYVFILSPLGRFLPLLAALCLPACGGAPKADADACPTSSTSAINNITNFCVATPGTLWRGSKPDAAGAAWLMDNGVKTIVNLELINDDLTTLTAAPVARTGNTTVNYFRVRNFEPVVALAPALQDEQIAQFLAIMATQPKPVYVHCRSGQNRTGVNVAAYRVLVEGVAPEAAITEMGKYKGFWFSYDADYIRSFSSERRAAILARAALLASSTMPLAVVRCQGGACISN